MYLSKLILLMLIILILPFLIYNLLVTILGIIRDIYKYKQSPSFVLNRLFPLKLNKKNIYYMVYSLENQGFFQIN